MKLQHALEPATIDPRYWDEDEADPVEERAISYLNDPDHVWDAIGELSREEGRRIAVMLIQTARNYPPLERLLLKGLKSIAREELREEAAIPAAWG